MAVITTYLADKLLDHAFGKSAYTMPTIYIGLSTTTPTIAGSTVTEPSGGAYARQATSAATWASAASNSNSNAAAVAFATASANWASSANMTYMVAYDASSAGNLLWFEPIGTPQPVLSGNTASFAIGAITTSLN
jgi:hypothetical protein